MSQLNSGDGGSWVDAVDHGDTQPNPAGPERVVSKISTRLGREPTPRHESISDRYRVLRELGRGGYGAVYLAVDTRNDELVALKVPTENLDPDLHVRFVREAYTL